MSEELEELRARGVAFETAPCPMGCRPNDRVVLKGRDRVTELSGRFTVVRCQTCGLRRTDPRPAPQSMSLFYPDSYAPYHAEMQPAAASGKASKLGRLVTALGLRSHLLPDLPPGRMLEIGCASGHFLQTMRERGWIVQGIEYSASAAATAQAQGFTVQVSSIENATPPDAKMDLVVGWMVAEHLHDPRAALARLRQWVTEDGWIVLSVPDASALEARIFGDAWYALQVPTHLYHYTPRTLSRLLQATGWRVERVRRQPNAMNLLNSLSTALQDRGASRAAGLVEAFAKRGRFAIARRLLGIALGVSGQSGRMEIWARAVATASAERPASSG